MLTPTIRDALRASRHHALSNAAVLDHIANPQNPPPHSAADPRRSPSPDTPLPISKHVLSTVFAALDRPPPTSNYVFVENNQQDHFLYGLVLPLIARVFAVSCPGLLAVVQLPRPDICPEWATQSSDDGYGSNGSNGSKSNAATIPSFVGNSRTPSPSDDENSADAPKSNSPEPPHPPQPLKQTTFDHQPHTQQQPSKQPQTTALRSEPTADRNSPSPDAGDQDYRALRLICNGFEVLTGKMPPPRKDMGRFSLATVGWDKAGIIQPSHPSKSLSMSFSNGMVTPTEGIVVTFSNGSLCVLTLCDPLSYLQQLKVSQETPVMVFTYATVGHLSIGELINKNTSSLTEAAMRVKTICEKPNFMFVEIGHGEAPLTNSSAPSQLPVSDGQGKECPTSHNNPPNGTKHSAVQSSQDRPSILRYVPFDSIPRAIPLFVNTINQCFIDPPYQDIQEHAYENALMSDRYCVEKGHPDPNPPPSSHPQQVEAPKSSEKPCSEAQKKSCSNPTSKNTQGNAISASKSAPVDDEKFVKPIASVSGANAGKIPTSSAQGATIRDSHQQNLSQNSYPPMYSYYGYHPDHAYPMPPSHGPDPFSGRVVQHPIEVDRNQFHPNHGGYYFSHPSNGMISNAPPYAHQLRSSYHVGAYYPMRPHHGLPHQVPERNPAWQHGIPAIAHGAEHMQTSHLVHQPGRDMSVAYTAHQQFQQPMGGQYASQYYVVPPSSQIYGQTPAPTVAHPKGTGHPHSYAETFSGVPHSEKIMTEGKNPAINQDREPKSSQAAMLKTKGSTVTSNPRDHNCGEDMRKMSSKQESGMDEEKEKASQVLVGMRGGSVRSSENINSDTPKHSADALSDAQDCNNHGQRAPASEERAFSQAPQVVPNIHGGNQKSGQTVSNEFQSSPSRLVGVKRQQRSSRTQSSTSTNSQGTMLMNGVVTGSSHGPGQAYTGWKSKRPRQR